MMIRKFLEFLSVSTIIFLGCFSTRQVLAEKANLEYRTIFKDDFKNGKLNGWTMGGKGTWFIQNGKLTQIDSSLDGDWYERPTIIVNKVTVSDNVIIETKFNLLVTGSGSCAIIRLKCSQDLRNCIFVAMWEGTDIIIGEVIDNVEDKKSWYTCQFEIGIEHSIMIKIQGATIEVFVDGTLMATDNNYGNVYQSGKFGFTTYNTYATFDDVMISILKS